MAWTDNWGMGFSGRINLVDGTPPLNRRLDQGELFVEYHPVCYRVRASYTEQVATTLEAGVSTYYLDRRFKLSFDLTGLVGGAAPPPSTSTLSTTADADASPQAHCRS